MPRPQTPLTNSRAFEAMDSEEEAYWLGFLFTDGCLDRRGVLVVTLNDRDRDHLETLRQWLGWRHPLRRASKSGYGGSACSRLAVTSTALHENLLRAGLHPAKTWTIEPWNGPDYLMRHFWRGCLDGDGTITFDSDGKRGHIGFWGNEQMVKGLSAFIQEEVGSRGCVISKESSVAGGQRCFRVSWCGNGICQEIARLLYSGSTVSLPRKQFRAERLITLPIQRRRFRCGQITPQQIKSTYATTGRWDLTAQSLGISYPALFLIRRRFAMA